MPRAGLVALAARRYAGPPMSDPPAAQIPVTAEALAENERKQQAYAARRRAWTSQVLRREREPEPELASGREGNAGPQGAEVGRTNAPRPPSRGRRGGTVHDKRQRRLDL